jgi:hypothetical protein
MKTKREIKKKFDAVAFMRRRREEISKEISEMTPEQEIKYFSEKSDQFKRQKK